MSINPNITGMNGLGDALAEMVTHHARALPSYPKVLTNVEGRQLVVSSIAEEVAARRDGYLEKGEL